MRPSFLGLIASGFLILAAIIYIFIGFKSLNAKDMITIILLLSIAVSTHSVLHYHEEIHFKFNPMRGNWRVYDEPQK